MQYPRSFKGGTALLAALCLSACPVEDPSVVYDEPLAGQAAPSGATLRFGTGGAGAGAYGGGAGSVASSAGAGSSAAAGSHATAGAGASAAAGSGADASAGSSASASAPSVSFAVTTAAQGGRYQPKNIGAIWIQTPSGGFVKTLELWAKTRRRYLTKFNGNVGTTGAVDVVASATLPNHIAHRVAWDHRDRSGATLAEGAFRLCAEVTDADATGKFYCLDFDTRAGAQSLKPADQTYFKSLALSIE